MKRLRHVILTRLALAAAATLPFAPPAAALNLGTQPLYLGGSIPPIVMLVTEKDHQLFKKAYDDFSDLDGSGMLTTTYKHSINYYGYFDPSKCYTYSNANGRFQALSITVDKYCSPGTAWAGNFLNWVTMARLDIMRKMLYGGYRSTDINGTTVLERATVPTDVHSWAKHYHGADLAKLVPFSTLLTTPRTYTSTTSNTITTTSGTAKSFTVNNPATDVHPLILGDQVTICQTGSVVNCMTGRVTTPAYGAAASVTFTIDAGSGAGTFTSWTITNLTSLGISICNATQATSGDSNSTLAPPLARVVAGDYTLWGTSDTGQTCRFSDVGGAGEIGGPSGNRMYRSELGASEFSPLRNLASTPSVHLNDGSGVTNGDYIVRVVACDTSFIGGENCTQYPNGNFKPTGLLQDYAAGQLKKIKFGLLSGSYTKNKSGGVLRKNPGFLDGSTSVSPSLYDATVDEIDPGSGIFNTTATTPGIIRSFNSIKLYGWAFTAGSGSFSGGGAGALNDNCGTATNVTFSDNQCTSWGNPISEMYVEAIRFLAGKTADPNFTFTQSGSKDASLGLLQPAWVDPLNSNNYCTPLNVIMINASVNSYDNDQLNTDLFAAGTTEQTLTKLVGDYESITGNSFMVGNNGVITNGLCTPKSVSDFGAVSGICPEAPALAGSYEIAGTAWWARTNRIRAALATGAPPASDTRSLKVTTYGITLANGIPTIAIPVPGSNPVRNINILPASRTFNATAAPNDRAGGGIVDFKVIRQDLVNGTGKFFVSWDNAQNGSDFDLDVWGTIEYQFLAGASQIQVTTAIVYGAASSSTAFGYVITGTTNNDGMHFQSGFQGGSGTNISYGYPGNFTFSTGVPATPAGTVECSGCMTAAPPSALASQTFTVSAAPAATLLKNPLWYASKYGGFTDQNGNGRPDLITEWDNKNNLTGADGPDGIPDTYFPVTSPGALQQALDRAFISVLQVSSASSVATNSTSLQSGSVVYQARFNANEWSG
jgi:type IV pilus assembly protein PilY1